MAGITVGRVERHLCHITYVDTNSREDPTCTYPPQESLVEYYIICYTSRTYNLTYAYNDRLLQIDFDFIEHMLVIQTDEGSTKRIPLRPQSVSEFYKETMTDLGSLGMPVTIWTTPVEVQDRTPFEEDFKHVDYDPEYAQRVWRILAQGSRILSEFSSRFIGKVSPVHFFWGAFDLAVTRFSGRTAPLHPGAPNMARF